MRHLRAVTVTVPDVVLSLALVMLAVAVWMAHWRIDLMMDMPPQFPADGPRSNTGQSRFQLERLCKQVQLGRKANPVGEYVMMGWQDVMAIADQIDLLQRTVGEQRDELARIKRQGGDEIA